MMNSDGQQSVSRRGSDITLEDYTASFPDKQWVVNKDYDPNFERFKASLGQPQLAGWFDIHRLKYKSQCPWNLTQSQTVKEYYMDFMNQVGGPVGWTGTYPLVFTKGKTAVENDPQAREDEVCSTAGGKPNKYGVDEQYCRAVVKDCALKETRKNPNASADDFIKCADTKLMRNH
ncbi:hypothetical protein J3458_012951 [Metarhizium acridum]|uniref:uncharacterized protein n=1 Tax=Metarhizium acridum TaxID=92637 RepID=UPI001C6C8AA1|nr:hypothetical protein J3458_012951 [Metarhizium acridum]